jgi:leucyl aminopeptidase
MSTYPQLILEVISASDFDGDLVISPQVAAEEPGLGIPGKKVGDVVLVYSDTKRMTVSLGVRDKLGTSNIRKAGASAARWLLDHQTTDTALKRSVFDDLGIDNAFDVFCEGLLLGAFRFIRHKSKENNAVPVHVHILSDGDDSSLKTRVDRISALAEGVNLAREWSHEPPNIINPITLGERSRALAVETGLKCTVYGEEKLAEMGAGAILSVGLGSKTPSHMIVLEHRGHGDGVGSAPVVVVGKAITFDTGGYSLKNTKGMVGMKFDKCGGMAVLGIMKVVAALNLTTPVVGIIAAAENMISSFAYRPNDIITSLSGKTIEIISTDAEGRMVLSDALTYASTELKPRAIIDIATLTGGVVTALGKFRAGLMSNDNALAAELETAGDRTDEPLWRLPLDEEYFQLIKGTDSDIKNSAGVPLASSIVGGTFLNQFVMNDVPWAHIDIAGTATTEANGAKQATGFGVRLLVDYISQLT